MHYFGGHFNYKRVNLYKYVNKILIKHFYLRAFQIYSSMERWLKLCEEPITKESFWMRCLMFHRKASFTFLSDYLPN